MSELINKWDVVNKLIHLENEFQHYKPFEGFEHAMYRKLCNLEIEIGKTPGIGWIPVSERLPEVVDSYIVVVKYKYDYEKEYSYDTDVATYNPYEPAYIDDCWNTYVDWDEGQQYIHVTHWMPLPDVPKEENR